MQRVIKILASAIPVMFILWTGVAGAAESPGASAGAPKARADRELLGEILRASGVHDGESRRQETEAFEAILRGIESKVGGIRSSYRRARRILDVLHQELLLRYDPAADGLDRVLHRGEFNCLSASLTYGLAVRAFGIDARLIEIPRHVFVRLRIDSRSVDVEATKRAGFDLHPPHVFPGEPARIGENDLAAGPDSLLASGAAVEGFPRDLDLEEGVALLWHNVGRRALDRGDGLEAAVDFREEWKRRPDPEPSLETLAALLARAFRLEYESGRFEAAYRVAAIGLEILPGQTTARDRVLASALKRIEADAAADRPERAEAILDEAGGIVTDTADRNRLERGACPIVAAAAVRTGEWDLATRMAGRFAAAEPDRVEVTRLYRWVALRRKEVAGRSAPNACVTPPSADASALWLEPVSADSPAGERAAGPELVGNSVPLVSAPSVPSKSSD